MIVADTKVSRTVMEAYDPLVLYLFGTSETDCISQNWKDNVAYIQH
jgi:hypothetical protein